MCWEARISIPDGDRRRFEQFLLDGDDCYMHNEGRGENAAVVVFGDRGSTFMGERHGKAYQESARRLVAE